MSESTNKIYTYDTHIKEVKIIETNAYGEMAQYTHVDKTTRLRLTIDLFLWFFG